MKEGAGKKSGDLLRSVLGFVLGFDFDYGFGVCV
jgi:hypothetical protein